MMVGVLLAAGASTRMGRAKALVKCGPESFVAHGVRNLWSACDSVVVVLGADAAPHPQAHRGRVRAAGARAAGSTSELHAARRHNAQKLEVRFVVNRQWKKGMYTSVRVGLAAAAKLRPAAVLVLPVDHPQSAPPPCWTWGR